MITTVTLGREAHFADFANAAVMARLIADRDSWPGAKLDAWVLMPDHVHALVTLQGETSLSTVVNRAKGRLAFGFNRATGRRGPLWKDGFHDRAVRTSEDVRAVARYIIANPLRAKLVKEVGEYPFWDAVWVVDRDFL
jgi:putative transposase